MLFLHFGGPWDYMKTPGAPFCHPRRTILLVLDTWRDLGVQFVDPWAPFGALGVHFGYSTALGPDLGPLLQLFWKRYKKEVRTCVSISLARAD